MSLGHVRLSGKPFHQPCVDLIFASNSHRVCQSNCMALVSRREGIICVAYLDFRLFQTHKTPSFTTPQITFRIINPNPIISVSRVQWTKENSEGGE